MDDYPLDNVSNLNDVPEARTPCLGGTRKSDVGIGVRNLESRVTLDLASQSFIYKCLMNTLSVPSKGD
jgi:hypothetical protein